MLTMPLICVTIPSLSVPTGGRAVCPTWWPLVPHKRRDWYDAGETVVVGLVPAPIL